MQAPMMPISELSAYKYSWQIKARISGRSQMREYNSNGKPGKVFSVDLQDKSGEIRGSFFNTAAEKFNSLEEGGVYTFTKGKIKVANKAYNKTGHNYEITFFDDATITKVDNDPDLSADNFKVEYKFVELRALKNFTPPTQVDLCVMVKQQEAVREITAKNVFLRKLTVVDSSEHSMELAIWDQVRCDDNLEGKCIVIKKCSLKDYNGRTAATNTKSMDIDSDLPEAAKLRAWWAAGGSSADVQALSVAGMGGNGVKREDQIERGQGSFEELKARVEQLQVDGKIMWTANGYMTVIKTNKKGENQPLRLTYDSCPACMKKTIGVNCPKCNKDVTPVARYLLSSVLWEDHSAKIWAGAFDEAGKIMLNQTAEEVKEYELSAELVQKKLAKRQLKEQYKLTIRGSREMYQGEAKSSFRIMACEPVQCEEAGVSVLAQLAQMYNGASPEAQEAVRAMIAQMKTEEYSKHCGAAWDTGLQKIKAVVA